MNSEVDLTKQCYQIWQKVANINTRTVKKSPNWPKSAKTEKKGFHEFPSKLKLLRGFHGFLKDSRVVHGGPEGPVAHGVPGVPGIGP